MVLFLLSHIQLCGRSLPLTNGEDPETALPGEVVVGPYLVELVRRGSLEVLDQV